MTPSSPERDTATRLPCLFFTVLMLCRRMVPLARAEMALMATERLAAPPMWKVRMVSWVPGSPMDWAAITPTASPSLT
jgi:hypothetical protein